MRLPDPSANTCRWYPGIRALLDGDATQLYELQAHAPIFQRSGADMRLVRELIPLIYWYSSDGLPYIRILFRFRRRVGFQQAYIAIVVLVSFLGCPRRTHPLDLLSRPP